MINDKLSVAIVIPVYNEEEALKNSIPILHSFLSKNLNKYFWQIIIADNASTDNTLEVSRKLAKDYSNVKISHLNQKGRGRAVKKVWSESKTDIVSYMDVDLSTRLEYFIELIDSLTQGYDIAIGSRLKKGAVVRGRTLKREIISRCYNFLIKILFWTKFSDAQCGFKAASRDVIDKLIPYIKDNEWFFDSELLIVGEKLGYKIYEVPVVWVDDLGTTVKVVKTAMGDIKGLLRLFKTKPWRFIGNKK